MPFYPHKNPKNQNFEKWKNFLEISSFYTCVPKITIYDVRFLRYGVRQTECFVILGHFLPFYHDPLPPNVPEIQGFYPPNGSWNTRYDRLKFLSFWVIFCPFSPLTTWKIKILTLKKKHLEILSFYTLAS